jgi:hypothetical protein
MIGLAFVAFVATLSAGARGLANYRIGFHLPVPQLVAFLWVAVLGGGRRRAPSPTSRPPP